MTWGEDTRQLVRFLKHPYGERVHMLSMELLKPYIQRSFCQLEGRGTFPKQMYEQKLQWKKLAGLV